MNRPFTVTFIMLVLPTLVVCLPTITNDKDQMAGRSIDIKSNAEEKDVDSNINVINDNANKLVYNDAADGTGSEKPVPDDIFNNAAAGEQPNEDKSEDEFLEFAACNHNPAHPCHRSGKSIKLEKPVLNDVIDDESMDSNAGKENDDMLQQKDLETTTIITTTTPGDSIFNFVGAAACVGILCG